MKLLDLRAAALDGASVDLPGAWSLVWIDRDPRWQAESFRKFMRHLGVRLTVRETRVFRDSLKRDRGPSLEWLGQWGHPILVVQYEAFLADPQGQAARVAAHMPWADLDVDAMSRVVHDRSPRALPDLAVELASAGEP